ncbi:MAG TPA: hypothetical protein VFD58_10095 [Blastocatellia bacterium]|nr:hypothetical protein [Blastocatellia bacterium]
MRQAFLLILSLAVLSVTAGTAVAQTIRNPKLGEQDLAAARAITSEAGGEKAELTYAVRIDAIEKGRFDTLVVIYARPASGGPDYFALVVQEDKKYRLAVDGSGRALKSGDQFLRMGLRHEEGKAPLLRLMGAVTERGRPGAGQRQRNVDYRFNGTEFVVVDQSVVQLPK